MDDRFAEAVAFAAKAHAGQVYKGYGGRSDEPYILHPLRVALAVREECRVVAVLHDVLEDTSPPLVPEFVTDTEMSALGLLTRMEGESYESYIATIAGVRPHDAADNIAREVKIADLRDNLAHNPPPRLRSRYEAALDKLAAPPSENVQQPASRGDVGGQPVAYTNEIGLACLREHGQATVWRDGDPRLGSLPLYLAPTEPEVSKK